MRSVRGLEEGGGNGGQVGRPESGKPAGIKLHLMRVLWPSFLAAGVCEAVVFTSVDPLDIHSLAGYAAEVSRTGVYTIGFFVFWAITAASSALTLYLACTAPAPPP